MAAIAAYFSFGYSISTWIKVIEFEIRLACCPISLLNFVSQTHSQFSMNGLSVWGFCAAATIGNIALPVFAISYWRGCERVSRVYYWLLIASVPFGTVFCRPFFAMVSSLEFSLTIFWIPSFWLALILRRPTVCQIGMFVVLTLVAVFLMPSFGVMD